MQQMGTMQSIMAANNMFIPETTVGGFETQSATDVNHNFSQLITNFNAVDRSKESPNSSRIN